VLKTIGFFWGWFNAYKEAGVRTTTVAVIPAQAEMTAIDKAHTQWDNISNMALATLRGDLMTARIPAFARMSN